MPQRASGPFDVKIAPQKPDNPSLGGGESWTHVYR